MFAWISTLSLPCRRPSRLPPVAILSSRSLCPPVALPSPSRRPPVAHPSPSRRPPVALPSPSRRRPVARPDARRLCRLSRDCTRGHPLVTLAIAFSSPSRPVALALSPPFPSPLLSPLPSRSPCSLPSLPVALALSPPFPSSLLSPLPSRRPCSLPSRPIALACSLPALPAAPNAVVVLPVSPPNTHPFALALAPKRPILIPRPNFSSHRPPHRLCSCYETASPRPSSLPSHHPTSFRDFAHLSLSSRPPFRRPVSFVMF
ncbi:unnamed protein product [Closterium sp. NIES-65]|nr:unnamed protein product [Closterium sp. NIES-65]